MKNKMFAAVTMAVVSAVAIGVAAVTFDPATGAGFVGKGDVQLAFGWNNRQLQENAALVDFRYNAVTEVVTSWTCSRPPQGNQTEPIVQERSRTVSSSTQGIIDTIARERNQVTGFILSGWDGDPATSSETDGPALYSCPNASSGYVFDEDSVLVDTNQLGGGLEVTNGTTWVPIQ